MTKKLSDVKRIEISQEYTAVRVTTYKQILALGWETARRLNIYDPVDGEVYFVDNIYNWIQANPRFHSRQILEVEVASTDNIKIVYNT